MAPRLTVQSSIRYATSSDGYRCAVRVWQTDDPIGRIVFVHGIISHGGWYLQSCESLARAGFEVHLLDRRGSGLNDQSRGDVDNYETWLTDVEDYVEDLPTTAARLLVGISWGGKLVVAIVRRRPSLVRGVGLLCPGIFARQFPSRWKYAALSLAKATGLEMRQVRIPLQDPALFTDSPRWQRFICDDPATLRKITIRFALADRQLTRLARDAPEKIQTPTLLMLAGQDRIVDNAKTRQFFQQIGTDRKKLVQYHQAAHTLEFEPEPQTYFEDLCRWANEIALNQ